MYKRQGARDAATPARVARLMLRVSDLDRSLQFYTEGLGFSVLRKRSLLPARAAFTAVLGGGGAAAGAPSRAHGTTLELVYEYGSSKRKLNAGASLGARIAARARAAIATAFARSLPRPVLQT